MSSQYRHLGILTLATALTSLSSGSQAQNPLKDSDPVEASVLNLSYWEKFDWNAATKSRIWKDKRWETHPEAKEPQKDIKLGQRAFSFLNKRNVNAYDLEWDASLVNIRSNSGASSSPAIVFNSEVEPTECASKINSISAKLGEGLFSDESLATYFSQTAFVKVVMQENQWTLGNTRIEMSCFGIQASTPADPDKPEKLSLNIRLSSVQATPKIKPAFVLRCTRNLRLTSDPLTDRPLSEMVIRVVPRSQDIRNTFFSSIITKDSAVIDENYIRFRTDNNKVTTTFTIDRTTGILESEARDNSRVIGNVTGNCEKVSTAQKF
jgi:hypothetical protein